MRNIILYNLFERRKFQSRGISLRRLVCISLAMTLGFFFFNTPTVADTAPPEKADWTLAFYLAGENSLEQEQARNLKEILRAAGRLDQVNMVVFFDRDERFDHETAITSWKGTRVFHVTPPYTSVMQRPLDLQLPPAIQAERFERLILDRLEEPDDRRRVTAVYTRVQDQYLLQPTTSRQHQEVMRLLTEKAEYLLPLHGLSPVNLPATDARTQRQFFCFLQDHFPAQKYGLFMVGHGTGWYEKEIEVAPAAAVTHSDSAEYFKSLKGSVLADASRWLHFDFIAMDSCLMADLETLWTLKNAADYLILNQIETPSRGLNYSRLLEGLSAQKERTPQQWAVTVADAYARSYGSTPYPISVSVFDTRQIERWVEQWQRYWSEKKNRTVLLERRPHLPAPPTFTPLRNAMVDITDLCRSLGLDGFEASISGAEGIIIYGYRQHTKTKGLSIYLPGSREVFQRTISHYRSTLLSEQFSSGWLATVEALFAQ